MNRKNMNIQHNQTNDQQTDQNNDTDLQLGTLSTQIFKCTPHTLSQHTALKKITGCIPQQRVP